MSAELYLLRVLPDPKRVGVVAELIATERPYEKASSQIQEAVASVKKRGVEASGEVRVGRVARTIISVAKEIDADMVFMGTVGLSPSPFFMMPKDPIVHYLVEHCPISLCLVRGPLPTQEEDE
jgi:nucleotide-binding universal stress UspA family protein